MLAKMRETREKHLVSRDSDNAFQAIVEGSRLLSSALTIVRMSEERPKKDEDRDPAYQQRNWQRLAQSRPPPRSRTIPCSIARPSPSRCAGPWRLPERRPFAVELDRQEEEPERGRKSTPQSPRSTRRRSSAKKARVNLLENADAKQLGKSKDPLVKLALKLRPAQQALELDGKAFDGAMSVLRPKYIDALRTFRKGVLAPDANGTCASPTAPSRGPEAATAFTLVPEIRKKTTGRDPFNTPTRLLEAAAQKDDTYRDPTLGEVPVDFLAISTSRAATLARRR